MSRQKLHRWCEAMKFMLLGKPRRESGIGTELVGLMLTLSLNHAWRFMASFVPDHWPMRWLQPSAEHSRQIMQRTIDCLALSVFCADQMGLTDGAAEEDLRACWKAYAPQRAALSASSARSQRRHRRREAAALSLAYALLSVAVALQEACAYDRIWHIVTKIRGKRPGHFASKLVHRVCQRAVREADDF
jgi:hypothetical protein